MTTISAKVIAHSRCRISGKEIATLQLRYPRFIHAEFMTHRQFSRNASSSRAIPVSRLIEDIRRDPAMPLYWGKNQKGMQAGGEINEPVTFSYPCQFDLFDNKPTAHTLVTFEREAAWLQAMEEALNIAQGFDRAGYHKQIVNRLLEPFSHINVVMTSTEFSNWFALRDHPDAEPHIAHLAREMREKLYLSDPMLLSVGEWHTPYVYASDEWGYDAPVSGEAADAAIKLSVARCARTSYLTHDGRIPDMVEDLKLHDRLVGGDPLHASPAEHQATPDPYGEARSQWGNFSHFKQYRKTLPGECK